VELQEVWQEQWGNEGIEIELTYSGIERQENALEQHVSYCTINPLIHIDAMDITTSDMRRRAEFEKALPALLRYIKEKEMAQRYWAWRNRSWALKPIAKVRRIVKAKRGK
jgi:hypothetical protein